MIRLEQRETGVILLVKAQPGASNNGLRGEHNGLLKVSVTQVAEKGKANEAIRGVLAKSLGLRKGQIELLSGTTSSEKTFVVSDCTIEQLRLKIEAALK